MNSLYIGVGVAVILALVTALIGPLFVDWGTHRALFEAEASRIVGLPVKVLGGVDARLIPAPRVRFGDVVIGDLAHPVARVGRFELDLDVAGLIRGETKVSDLLLDRPTLDVVVDAGGRLEGLPERGADLAGVRIETVRFSDGRLSLTDRRSGASVQVGAITGTGAVENLAGTWRLEAKGLFDKRPVGLRLASRRGAEGARLRVSANLDGEGTTFGGDLALGGAAGRPTLAGPITIDRAATASSPVVKIAGRLDLDPDGARLDDLAVDLGEKPDATTFSGSAQATFATETTLEASLSAQRIDLDGTTAAPGGARARLRALGETAREMFGDVAPPRRTRVSVAIDTVAVAGGLVSDVAGTFAVRPGGISIETASARLPGDGRLSLAGRVDLVDRVFDGRGTLSASAPETLAAWWSGEAAGDARIGEASLSGAFTLSRDGFSGADLDLTLGATRARGRVESRADGLVRLGLTATKLDGDRSAAFLARLAKSRMVGGAAGIDLDVDVDELTFGRIVGRGARLSMHAAGGTVSIDRLALADLAGARITASGRIDDPAGAPNGRIEARLAADRPGPAARVIAEILAPGTGATAEAIGAAAGPLDLTVALTGRHDADATAGGAGTLEATAKGRAAGGALDLSLRWTGRLDDLAHGRLDGRLGLDGATLSDVAARLLDARPKDRVVLTGRVAGRPVEGLDFGFEAGLGDRRLSAEGTLLAPDGGVPRARVRGRLAAPDLGLLAAFAGDPVLALERRLPVDVAMEAEGWGRSWAVSRLAGTLAETKFEASGRIDAEGRRAKLAGDLSLDRADLATLVGAAFASPADFSVATRIASLDLSGERTATAVAATVDGDESGIRASALSAGVGAARIGGDLRARRVPTASGLGAATAVSGRLSATLDGFSTAAGARRPVLAGRLSGEIAFEATGRDAAGLVASASGSGRLRLDGGRLDGVGLSALKAPREGEGSAAAIVAAMATATTPLPALDLPLLLEKGRVQVPPTTIDLDGGRAVGRLAGDLVADRVEGVVGLEPAGEGALARATAVSHALPSLDLVWSGSIEAPRLDVDTAGLSAFLTLHGVEREIEAAETARQDRIERRRFSTLLDLLERRRRAREAPVPGDPPPPPPLLSPPLTLPPAGDTSPQATGRQSDGPRL